jgi:hypothetical protein
LRVGICARKREKPKGTPRAANKAIQLFARLDACFSFRILALMLFSVYFSLLLWYTCLNP